MEIDIYPIDIIFGILILVAAVRAAFRGFVTEALSMAAFILGIAGAILFHRMLAEYIETLWGASMWNVIIAFLVLFVVIYLVAKLLEGILHKILMTLRLDKLDKALGFFLGIIEGVIVVAVILFLMAWQPFFDVQELIETSVVSRFLSAFIPSPAELNVPKIQLKDV